jgi:hypothetical protein
VCVSHPAKSRSIIRVDQSVPIRKQDETTVATSVRRMPATGFLGRAVAGQELKSTPACFLFDHTRRYPFGHAGCRVASRCWAQPRQSWQRRSQTAQRPQRNARAPFTRCPCVFIHEFLKSLESSLLSILCSFGAIALVVASPISAISSARVNSDISNEVTSGATTKSAGPTPTEFML